VLENGTNIIRALVRKQLVLVVALAAGVVAGAQAAIVAAPTGSYFFAHPNSGNQEFSGGFTLHAGTITAIGITTTMIACTRPPSKKVQYPGPPDNWQPQKTVKVVKHGSNLTFSYSGAFADRINGYPETMKISGTITPAGVVTGRAAMTEDDNTASTGEIKCATRGFVSFTGKHS
jgi:hypothetical protein